MGGKSSLGFVVGKLHIYLGHFAKESVLRAGHNTNGKRDEEAIAEMQRKRDEALKQAQTATKKGLRLRSRPDDPVIEAILPLIQPDNPLIPPKKKR